MKALAKRVQLGALALATGLVVGVLGMAAPASAHVTVSPKEAPMQGYAKLTFQVPNEKESQTTKLEVVFDDKHPLPYVGVRPAPGWTVEKTMRTLDKPIKVHDEERTEVVDRIVWTAQPGSEINPGEFQTFDISAGPLPGADKLTFKALQTYSDGETVAWIDENHDADHPAPVLTLTKAEADHHGGSSGSAHGDDDGDDATSAKKFGLAGLAAGVIGMVLGGVALARSRRS